MLEDTFFTDDSWDVVLVAFGIVFLVRLVYIKTWTLTLTHFPS